MLFRLAIAEYDAETERAYVEFRSPDHGGDQRKVSLQLGRIAPTLAHDAFRYVLSGE